MKIRTPLTSLLFIALFACTLPAAAQDTETDTEEPEKPSNARKSKFLTGFYVGSYFANSYSAAAYNGYGFNLSGQQNSFVNSAIYQKIINEYGGGYGQTDQIAQALGVDPHQWSFTESDMPVNMHYRPAILVGFNFKVPMSRKNAIIINVNGTKLGVEGNFTMTTLLPPTSTNPALNSNIKTFTILGKEQRILMQLAFQRIFGDDEKLNFFGEAGFIGTLTKFDQNTIIINNLTIDLTSYANQAIYPSNGPVKKPIGFGIGAFASLGLNIDLNPKFTIQLLYTLSHEKINIGVAPTLKLQNALGMRVYYNF